MDAERPQFTLSDPARAGRSPLGAAAWMRTPELLALGVVTTALTLVGLVVLAADPLSLAPAVDVGVLTYSSPLDDLRLLVELALLPGLAVVGVATVGYASRDDPRVHLSEARLSFVLAVVGGVAGFGFGRSVLVPVVFEVFASGTRTPVFDPYWAAEVGLFLPVAVGMGVATAPLLLGLVRVRALRGGLGSRTRGFVVLLVLVFAAGWSPPDPATFALFAAPPLCGLGVAVAWLEFGPEG